MLSSSVWSKQHSVAHWSRSAKVAAKKRQSAQLAQVKDKLHAHCDYRSCSEEELESLADDLTMEAGVEIHFGQMMAGLSTSVEGEDAKVASELARDCVVYLLLSGPEGSRTLVRRTNDEHYTALFQAVHGPQRVALVIGDVKLEWDRSNLVIPTQVNIAELAQLCGGDRPSSGIYSMGTAGTEDSPLSPFSFCRQLRLTPGATVSGAIRSLIRLIVRYNRTCYYDPLRRNAAQFCADGMSAMKVVSALEIGVHLRDYQTALKQSSGVPSSFDSHASLDAFVGKNRDTIRNQVDIERLLCLYVCFHLGDSGWQCGSCKAGMTCNMAVLEKHVNWQSLLINRFLPHRTTT